MPNRSRKVTPQLSSTPAFSSTSKFIATSAHQSSATPAFSFRRCAHLPAASHRTPQILIGQLTQRQYHYDALGQLSAIEAPGHTQRYGYDPAGRLRAMLSSLQPEQPIRWDIVSVPRTHLPAPV